MNIKVKCRCNEDQVLIKDTLFTFHACTHNEFCIDDCPNKKNWKGRLDKWCEGETNLFNLKLIFALILVILMEIVIINNLL